METLVLVPATREWQKEILDYRREFAESGDSIDGSGGLKTAPSLDVWFAQLRELSSEETLQKGMVPASTFLGVRTGDNRLVGMVNIRHRLNEGLLRQGGHIGYSVRASERRKGYAGQLLRLALARCRDMGIEKALVTCYKDNIPSARTILGAGGVLENEEPDRGRIVQRYWVPT